MGVKVDGKWVIGHPLEIIDRLDRTGKQEKEQTMHLDIFSPKSLERLKEFVDIDNPEALLTPRERVVMEREISTRLRSKER